MREVYSSIELRCNSKMSDLKLGIVLELEVVLGTEPLDLQIKKISTRSARGISPLGHLKKARCK